MEMQKHIYLLLACALAFLVCSHYVRGCFESEKQVLFNFNQSRVFPDDPKDDPMRTWVGDDCCSWQGIQCNHDGHVTDLHLEFLSLTGTISENIGNLTSLSGLYLWRNYFNGSLPESLCQLSKLEILDVRDNQLSGTIPKCIGGLSNLKVLSLSSNSWDGLISEQHFVNLTRLTILDVSSKSTLVFNVDSAWIQTVLGVGECGEQLSFVAANTERYIQNNNAKYKHIRYHPS